MPTSSQAMILRGTETIPCTRVVSQMKSPREMYSSPHSARTDGSTDGCELVKFDFSVSTSPEANVRGFEGKFAYNRKSKTYQWLISSVGSESPTKLSPRAQVDDGDHLLEDEFADDNEVALTESFIKREPSECTRHFTTPVRSLMDNSESNQHVIFPPEANKMSEATYRRLEGLGFRRRTMYTPGGGMIRLKRGSTLSVHSSPRSCMESNSNTEAISKLTINNLEPEAVPKARKSVPYKRERLGHKPLSHRRSFDSQILRKTQPQAKAKSLIDEVKECVNWSTRVAPTSHPRPVTARARNHVVCFSLRDSCAYSHEQVKDIVETQIQCQVKCLQFDPVSLRTRETDVLDRWIVTFSLKSHCEKAIERGLSVGGDKVIIRAWEDIMEEESLYEDTELGWGYPCSYRLTSDKHNRALKKFLQEN